MFDGSTGSLVMVWLMRGDVHGVTSQQVVLKSTFMRRVMRQSNARMRSYSYTY